MDEAIAHSYSVYTKSNANKETKFDVYMPRSSRAMFNEKNKDKGERIQKIVVD